VLQGSCRVAIPVLLAGMLWTGVSYSEEVLVQPGDTLWSIAKSTRSDHVSIRSQAEAIFKANRRAFSDDTMSSLLYGVRLTLPETTSDAPQESVQIDQKADSHKTITIIRGVSMEREQVWY